MPIAKWDRSKGSPEPVVALNRVVERDTGEPLVDVRSSCPLVLIKRPQVIPYLRKTVAEMLDRASRRLPEGIRFEALECWRPLERQRRIYDWHFQAAKEAFPDRPFASLRRTVNRFVAPVTEKAPPGHCTGAAVDVVLVDAGGEPIDVSSPFDRFSAAPTYSLGLDPAASKARETLVMAMLEEGFSNCRDEWWHYSWGDAGWAVRLGLTECHYGRIELEPELYAEQEALWEVAYRDRKNPFLEGR
ncbi:MAG TPA: M15 family metallopeptidase [Fimbriimonadaceae bacterium]|nr:M15 family metallopeptidase [Fimbriimonadaceae bacterium]